MKTLNELELTHKECNVCKIYKPFCEFPTRKEGSKSGLRYLCKDCSAKKSLMTLHNRIKDPEYHKDLLSKKRSQQTYDRDPQKLRIGVKKYQSKYPEKVSAQKKVRYQIKIGRMERKPCQICADPKSHAHHEDYSKPLDVIWLCVTHHNEIHQKFNTILEQLGSKKEN